MDDNFSPRVKDVIAYSKEEALRLGHDFIGTEHLMLGLLRDGNGKAVSILNALAIDLNHLRRKVEILSPANSEVITTNDKKNLHLTRQAQGEPIASLYKIGTGCIQRSRMILYRLKYSTLPHNRITRPA